MAELKHGAITLVIADELKPSEKAGTMDAVEVSRIPKVPLSIGQMCEDAAAAIEKAEGKFIAPLGVTAGSLREAGAKAEKIDQVINDAEVMISVLKQGALLFKAEAYEQVRKVNDQVKAQGKHNAELYVAFQQLVDAFTRLRRRRASTSANPPEPLEPPKGRDGTSD